MSLPSARQLAAIAAKRQWPVYALDESPHLHLTGRRTFYGGTDRAREYAARLELCLIEPPLDLITRVPTEMLCRDVRFGTLAELRHLSGPVFVKPADPIFKSFDAGVYRGVSDIAPRRPIDSRTPLLVSEAVEWTSEFRCFLRQGRVEAWSPYLSFGRPVWKPASAGALPPSLAAFCQRLVDGMGPRLPPAFVVDVGVLEDGRWAVVEFNPAWCSGILGADVEGVLHVLQRSAMWRRTASPADRHWMRLCASQ
jgi:hypothetical protein